MASWEKKGVRGGRSYCRGGTETISTRLLQQKAKKRVIRKGSEAKGSAGRRETSLSHYFCEETREVKRARRGNKLATPSQGAPDRGALTWGDLRKRERNIGDAGDHLFQGSGETRPSDSRLGTQKLPDREKKRQEGGGDRRGASQKPATCRNQLVREMA